MILVHVSHILLDHHHVMFLAESALFAGVSFCLLEHLSHGLLVELSSHTSQIEFFHVDHAIIVVVLIVEEGIPVVVSRLVISCLILPLLDVGHPVLVESPEFIEVKKIVLVHVSNIELGVHGFSHVISWVLWVEISVLLVFFGVRVGHGLLDTSIVILSLHIDAIGVLLPVVFPCLSLGIGRVWMTISVD